MWPIKKQDDFFAQPFKQLLEFRKEIDELFAGELVRGSKGSFAGLLNNDIDIIEKDENVVVKANLPEFKEKEIEVVLNDGVLTIKAERKKEVKKEEKGSCFSGSLYGAYQRSLILPSFVETSKTKADFKNGTLEILLPKKKEDPNKRIKVDVNKRLENN